MKRKSSSIVTLLILCATSSLFVLPRAIPLAYASVKPPGLVCIADPSSVHAPPLNPCPARPAALTGPVTKPPLQDSLTQLNVGAYIWNSDVVNGFDIQLRTNTSVLKPVGLSLSNSMISPSYAQLPTTIILECIGGILVIGTSCSPTDGPGVLHVVAVGSLTANPAIGLLFTATYNITGTSPVGGVSLGFQTGCTGTSVPGGVCISVTDGSTRLDSETVQSASFDNSSPPPFLTMSASPARIGSFFQCCGSRDFILNVSSPTSFNVGGSANASITLKSLGGFSATVNLSATISPNGLTATFATSSLPLTNTAATNCTLASNVSGVYQVTISAVSAALVHRYAFMVYVGVNYPSARDYGIAVAPANLQLNSVGSGVSNITISARNGFSGAVTLSTDASLGLVASLDKTSITGSGTARLTVSTYELGQYGVILTASNGTFTRSILVTVNVFIQPIITVTSQNNWPNLASNGIISLNIQASNGLTIFLNATECVPFPGVPCNVSAQFFLPAGGSYSATIFANYVFTNDLTGQNSSLAAPVSFSVNSLDFDITMNLSTVEFPPGASGYAVYTVTSKGGFAGQVTLFASANTGGSALSISYAPCNKPTCTLNVTAAGSISSNVTFASASPLGTRYGTRTSASYGTTATGLITRQPTLPQIVLINDFTITGPNRLKVDVNGANPVAMNFTSLGGTTNGFRGALTLSSSCIATSVSNAGVGGGGGGSHTRIMAPLPANPCPFISTASVSVTAGATVSSTVYIWTTSSTVGNYSLTVTAAYSSGLAHSLNITIIVTDFSVLPDIQYIAVGQSSSGNTTLRFASQNGFSDSLYVSASVSPAGPTVSLSKSTVVLLPGGSNSSLLTVSVPATTPVGTYIISVTASTFNGPIVHSLNITLQVKSVALQTNIFVILVGQALLVLVLPIALLIVPGIIAMNSRTLKGQASRSSSKIVHYRRRSAGDWQYFGFGFTNTEAPCY